MRQKKKRVIVEINPQEEKKIRRLVRRTSSWILPIKRRTEGFKRNIVAPICWKRRMAVVRDLQSVGREGLKGQGAIVTREEGTENNRSDLEVERPHRTTCAVKRKGTFCHKWQSYRTTGRKGKGQEIELRRCKGGKKRGGEGRKNKGDRTNPEGRT